jgi:hypothetical protein
MKLIIDNWTLNKNKNSIINVNEFDEVIKFIKQLNQKEHTQVILDNESSYLLIGGGLNKYVVSFVIDDETSFNLFNTTLSNNFQLYEDLVTGGQKGSFPEHIVVDYELMIKASEYYFNTGKMNINLKWEEE